MSSSGLAAACHALARGGIIAYPTEGVFGLGCDPANGAALERLLALKQRPWQKGLILIAADLQALRPWIAPLTAEVRARVEATWPGPVTWLLPAAPGCSEMIRGQHDTIAARITSHPVAAALCHAWGGALVSTSANQAGAAPARDATAVRSLFGAALDAVVEGEIGALEGPTPIRDARSGTSVRR